ncbi:hypothetical protein HAX54_016852 [Datura stramonium]|uniref:fructose-bisphosphate aldolase n=1 Tax=Datura stramonium TaxID=4076 RepID=A0ABS8UJR7_DATST|nr:hypothetical protein [Datura stramonium]
MALPLALLLTTNRELALPNGVPAGEGAPNGPSALAVKEAAWGLPRYASISQDSGLVPLWSQRSCWMVTMALTGLLRLHKKFGLRSFFTLLRTMSCLRVSSLPSMVTPGAECKDRATPEQVADYTLKLLQRRISAVPRNHVLIWWTIRS